MMMMRRRRRPTTEITDRKMRQCGALHSLLLLQESSRKLDDYSTTYFDTIPTKSNNVSTVVIGDWNVLIFTDRDRLIEPPDCKV